MDYSLLWEIAQKAGPWFNLIVLVTLGAVWLRITALSGENQRQIAAQSETTSAMERLADAMEDIGRSAVERDRLQSELIKLSDSQRTVGDARHTSNQEKMSDIRNDLSQTEQRVMLRISEVMQAINSIARGNGAGR